MGFEPTFLQKNLKLNENSSNLQFSSIFTEKIVKKHSKLSLNLFEHKSNVR